MTDPSELEGFVEVQVTLTDEDYGSGSSDVAMGEG